MMKTPLMSMLFLSLAFICSYNPGGFHQFFGFGLFLFWGSVTRKMQMSPQIPGYHLEPGIDSYFVCLSADD